MDLITKIATSNDKEKIMGLIDQTCAMYPETILDKEKYR